MKQPAWVWALTTLLQVLLPLWILLSGIMLVLVSAPVWVPIEYRLPGFPEDSYGFTLEERIELSAVDLAYLLGDEDISYFDDFTLADGSPMHNERELRHMQDVKILVDLARTVWVGGTLLLACSITLLVRQEGIARIGALLKQAARNTVVLVVLLIAGVAVSFRAVFVAFHRIFFEGDTWLFRYSDTFIRLYPERFWRDIFIYIGVATMGLSALLYAMGRRVKGRL